MNLKETLAVCMFTVVVSPSVSLAGEGHNLQEACKSECPAAKTEHETHKCMDEVVKKKKNEKTFMKSECFAAYREHEKHEKEEGHKH